MKSELHTKDRGGLMSASIASTPKGGPQAEVRAVWQNGAMQKL